MAVSMKVSSKQTIFKVTGISLGMMANNMKVFGNKVKWMAKEILFG